MYDAGNAPEQWVFVPAQRSAPPLTVHVPGQAPASRGGHHDWGAVVAALAVGIALVALLGTGSSVADRDHGSPQTAVETGR